MEKTHVLIIDDDKDTANLFRTILELVGFECHAMYSAKTALAHLATQSPDIILLDLRLGLELDGKDILYQIRSNPRFDNTRVIVITAYPGMLEQVDNLADLIMLKPVQIDDLTTLASRLTQLRPKSYLFRDPVSGLYSINFFMTRLEHAYERSKRNPELIFAALAIQFSVYAQGEGPIQEEDSEKLLKQIAQILNRDFRPTDTFGYLEKLRVVALYEDFKKPEDIFSVIQRLQKDLTLDLKVGDRLWHITPYIGAVVNHPRFEKPEDILQTAIDTLDRVSQMIGVYFLVADPFQSGSAPGSKNQSP